MIFTSNLLTAQELCDDENVKLKSYSNGKQGTTCPQCSEERKKKTAKCMTVNIDERGVRFTCHHCGWFKARFYDERLKHGTFNKARRVAGSGTRHSLGNSSSSRTVLGEREPRGQQAHQD